MDLDAVTADLKAALGTIDGLNVFDSNPERISPPAAWFGSPDTLAYDQAYGRGMELASYTVWVAVSRYPAPSTQRLLNTYMTSSGAKSVPAAVGGYTATAWSDATVMQAEGEQVVNVAGIDYLACNFTVRIAGSGS